MKNKNKHHDVILDYIKANPGSNIDGIKEGNPKLSDIIIRSILKQFNTENLVTVGDAGEYTLISKKNAATTEQPKAGAKDGKKAEKKDAPKKNEEEDLGPKIKIGSRDTTKYSFAGQAKLSKSRLCLLLVKTFVEKNPRVNLAELQEVFHSEELQKRFGVVCEASVARKFCRNNIDRHFMAPENLIKLASGTKIAVCNQWDKKGIDKLIEIVGAPPIGFKVKAEAAE
jgi:hypothetical protein